MNGHGFHWTPCRSPGGGGLVLLAAALAIGSGAVTAAISALEVIAVVIACLGAAAILGGIALLVYRARSDRPRAVFTARPVPPVPPEPRPQLEESRKPAIEPPRGEQHLHLHLDGADPEVIAAIMRHIKHDGR